MNAIMNMKTELKYCYYIVTHVELCIWLATQQNDNTDEETSNFFKAFSMS